MNDHSLTSSEQESAGRTPGIMAPPSMQTAERPALSTCPACFRSWADQAELNLRIAAALETLAVRISELNEMNSQHVQRIQELEQVVEYLHSRVDGDDQ